MPRNGRQNGIVELETILVLRCDQSKGSDSGNMKGKKQTPEQTKGRSADRNSRHLCKWINEIFRELSDIMFAMQNIRTHP